MKDLENFEKDVKASYIIFYTYRIVDEFMAYKKHSDISKFDFNHIVNGAADTINLSEKEMKQIVKNVKKLLRNVYGIKIANENPIRLEGV